MLTACATTAQVKVIDDGDKLPVQGAAVVAVRGNLTSERVYTDSRGEVAEPTLPGGARELLITKAGYYDKRVRIAP